MTFVNASVYAANVFNDPHTGTLNCYYSNDPHTHNLVLSIHDKFIQPLEHPLVYFREGGFSHEIAPEFRKVMVCMP